MGKKKKSSSGSKSQQRTRFNRFTGKIDTVPGTKAGKKRQRLAPGDPLRTHDLRGPVGDKKKKKKEPAV